MPQGFRSFLAAIIVFTRLPIACRLNAEDFSKSSHQLPLLAWFIGALQCGILMLLHHRVADDFRIFLVLLLPILLTGAMHEDGLADFCDGMLGAHSPEQSLTIMKDPRLGTFGVLSLMLSFFGNWLALRSIPADRQYLVLLSNAVLSRSFAISLLSVLPYISQAKSKSQAYLLEAPGKWRHFICLWPAGPALVLLSDSRLIFLTCLLLVSLHLIFKGYLKTRLGGLTGDCLGAAIKIAESALFTLMSWYWFA